MDKNIKDKKWTLKNKIIFMLAIILPQFIYDIFEYKEYISSLKKLIILLILGFGTILVIDKILFIKNKPNKK